MVQPYFPPQGNKTSVGPIQNFLQEGPLKIKLSVGDRVNISEENGDWYFGCLATNENIKGIFPKTFVRLKRMSHLPGCHTLQDGLENKFHSGIFTEIVPILKEWSPIWKQLYLKRDKNIMKIKDIMCDLIFYRKKILSGRLTKHQLSELKWLIASVIDVGNRMLGLDMVVRNEEGNVLPVKTTSAMKLFISHELSSSRVRQSLSNTTLLSMKGLKEDKKHHSYDLMISFMNFICIAEDDLELVLTLYDAVAACPISDNFVFVWKPNSSQEDNVKLQQLKVLFTDLVQKDIKQKQIYLVCYVIRIGSAELRESEYIKSLVNQDTSVSDHKTPNKKAKGKCKRRPYGVAAVEVSSYLNICAEDRGEDHIFLPFLRYHEGSIKYLLNHIISMKRTALEECGGSGLWFKLKLFNRDPREVIPLNHVKMENAIEIQKIGFPEVIMPANVRNEFFLTIVGGEFSRFMAPEKNVEVAVCLCSEDGKVIPGIIQLGDEYLNEYRSIIYYRESKPEWYETLKINMPISGLRGCHLKFTFTHRSAIFSAEKPFGMSYINIMKECGTLIRDGKHILNVFMIDHKKFEGDSCPYLNLPAKAIDVEMKKYNTKGLKLSEKGRFFIETYVCSTKLTQNVSLLRLLDWRHSDHELINTLDAFLKVDGGEIIKFLPDILDALFTILAEPLDLKEHGVTIFDCLVYILDTLSNEKYEHFLPVLNVYIEERFNAPLAYKKLTAVLTLRLTDLSLPVNLKVKILKSLNYFGSFILKSRKLCDRLQEVEGMETFIAALKDLINAVVTVCCNKNLDRKTQRNCLKYSYPLIFMIEDTLNSEDLAAEWCKQCCKLKNFIKSFGNVNARENITVINEVVESKIFLLPKWRLILTPVLLEKLMEYLNASTEVELCIIGLNGLLEPLQPSHFDDKEIQNHTRNTSLLMLSLLENVIEAIKGLTRGSLITGQLIALMIEILRQMATDTFQCYRDYFSTDEELIYFLVAMLIFFKEMVSRPFFPIDWLEMIMLQNSVILKSLKCIAYTIKDKFLEPINEQIWNNYFLCAVAYITQPLLQLENFSEKKCSHVLLSYMDMRLELACSMKDMWLTLGKHQRSFTPHLVGPFLEVALIPNAELQEAIIPIFFDMAHCEFHSAAVGEESSTKSTELLTHQLLNFSEVEVAIVNKFDMLINSGKGDDHFKDQLCNILEALFEQCEPMKIEGRRFVNGIKEQLERLLECRDCMRDGSVENGMICLFQLLDFYGKRKYQELYVQYVSKLCDWHIKYSYYAEAAKTLNLHAQLLDWSGDVVPPALRCSRYPTLQTCFELKENLYHDIIQYFDRGRMWLCAINFCRDLIEVYENKVYNYSKLADVLRKKSDFYEKIRTTSFPEIEYFYVSYYGLGFPAFFQNKTFVYRGNDFEGYQSFCNRVKNQFPKARLIKGLQGDDAMKSSQQYIQVIKIYPAFDETDQYSVSQIQEPILYHLHENDIQKFRFSSFKRNYRCTLYDEQYISGTENTGFPSASEEKSLVNWNSRTVVVTSQSFPWCLKLSPVTSVSTYEICPIWNAIEEIRVINRSLFGILPSEIYVSQNLKYAYLKLEEITECSLGKKLYKGIKALMKENGTNLVLLRKLGCLLNDQIDLISVFIEAFDSLDSLRKLLPYLKKCRDKLTFCCQDVLQNSPSTIKSSEVLSEKASVQPMVKKVSFKQRKIQSPKSPKLFTLFKDVNQSRDSNSFWYVPAPSSKLDEISFSSQYSVNRSNSKSVFHVPTPVSYMIPSLSVPSSTSVEELASQPSTDIISSLSNTEENHRKSIPTDQNISDDLPVNVDFLFQRNERSLPGKHKAISSTVGIRPSTVDVVADVPPPLPPKSRNNAKLYPGTASLGCVRNEGISKNQIFDYVNVSSDTFF